MWGERSWARFRNEVGGDDGDDGDDAADDSRDEDDEEDDHRGRYDMIKTIK